MNQIEIKVFRILVTGKEQVLMCRRCSFKSSDYFPYETIEASLRIIFGKDCFISFIVCPHDKC